MTVYRAPPVEAQPEVGLSQWRIYEVTEGDHHGVGLITKSPYDGRVTSKIMQWDPDSRIFTTRSGRRYSLIGDSRPCLDAEFVWAAWCSAYGIDPSTAKDVSDQYAAVNKEEDARPTS